MQKSSEETETDAASDSASIGDSPTAKPSIWQALDNWVLLQLVAVFSFSFAIGILFMHGTILWHQYKHGFGYFNTVGPIPASPMFYKVSLDKYPNVKNDIYEWSHHGQLRVNTSIFIR